MNLKDIVYSFACLSFAIVIGGAVYEHLAVVPQWSAAPPASLSMFQGEYGLNAGLFWMCIHPVTILLLTATLILFWKNNSRKNILITSGGYVLIVIVTATYFVPELMEITGTAFSETIDASLTNRAKLWELFSIVRLLMLVVLAIVLFLGLTKVNAKTNSQTIPQKISSLANVV